MKRPGLPANERERVQALDEYDLVDTPEEPLYDAFTYLAREVTSTSMSVISLVERDRAWAKSCLGVSGRSSPREESFCAHIVESGNAMVIGDARKDERFRDNPYVAGEPFIRFYAGLPLTNPDGYKLGTRFVIDDVPRILDESQIRILTQLARLLMTVLETRRRYMSMFDAANIDVFTLDPRDGSIVFASRGACRRLGYARAELIGMPIYDIIPGINIGNYTVQEAELTRSDGSKYPVELRLDVTREEREERILVIASDLTERRVQQSEIQLLLRAVNVAGDAILVYEVNGSGELRLGYVNEAYVEQSGYPRDEAIGRTMDDFRQSMPDDEGMRVMRASIAAGVAAQSEVVSYRKDGTTYWNQMTMHPVRNAAGDVTHWISVEHDISEEVERTSALAEEHDRLLALTRAARRLFTALDARTIVGTVRDVIVQLIGAEGRVLAVRADGAVAAVDELGAVDWSSAKPDALVARAISTRARVVDEGQARAVAPGGQFADARYALELRARSGRALRNRDLFVFDLIAEYFAVASRNVTLYHELDERRSAVLELNQTKSDLIAMLAHDFRGPLTSIVGFADLAGEVGDVNDEQREFLDTIKRSALQLSELATDTLTLARLERNEVSLQLSEVDLAVLAASIAAQYADRRMVTVAVNGDARVTGDDERLRQVFANLIDNAVKYSKDGAQPEVHIEGRDDDVVVTVIDRGIGIPAGELSRVFDRFSRASNARRLHISGTGFGLFMTKQLVQLHGGTIAVESEEDEGSRFIVTLPRRVDRRAAPRTVVIVDPHGENSFLSYGLQEAGYRALTVAGVDETIGVVDSQSVEALILAAPDALSGTDAVQFRAFSRERGIPIVAVGGEKNVARLMPSLTFPRPVLIGDVVAGLERLLVTP